MSKQGHLYWLISQTEHQLHDSSINCILSMTKFWIYSFYRNLIRNLTPLNFLLHKYDTMHTHNTQCNAQCNSFSVNSMYLFKECCLSCTVITGSEGGSWFLFQSPVEKHSLGHTQLSKLCLNRSSQRRCSVKEDVLK